MLATKRGQYPIAPSRCASRLPRGRVQPAVCNTFDFGLPGVPADAPIEELESARGSCCDLYRRGEVRVAAVALPVLCAL